ncbi:MAG: uracil-DNA glycosylase [Vicinamibacterales bacterium]
MRPAGRSQARPGRTRLRAVPPRPPLQVIGPRALQLAREAIVSCTDCPRLRRYCTEVALVKRAAFRGEAYWARPVPGYGDPAARLYVLGLAPAAHGANRTGRVFTGDGRGGSGDFLMAALHRAGRASIPTSQTAADGLRLRGVFVGAAARCAPPSNKPLPAEVAACRRHLAAEIAALPNLRVVVALGRIAWDAWLAFVAGHAALPRPRPVFAHGAVARLGPPTATGPEGLTLVGCFHPSRQNTHTGRVTPAMYDALFARAFDLTGASTVQGPGDGARRTGPGTPRTGSARRGHEKRARA